MSEYNNEAASLNFSFRRFLIIAFLPIMFAFFFNGVEVEVVSNDHADFHQYSENTVSPGTSYYDDGAVQPFASAWNSLAQNIARMLGYTHLISNNTNTTNSYIATLYTYLSNNLPGQWQTLSDIKTAVTNSAASDQALLQLVGDQVNIDWADSNCDYTGAYNSSWNTITPDQVYSYTDYYFRYSSFNINRDCIVKLELPMIAWSNNPKILSIDVESGVNQGIVTELYYYVSTPSNHVNLYLTPSLPSGTFYVHVKVQGNFKITTATDSTVYYLPNTKEDYFKLYDFILQYNMMNKDINVNIPDVEVNINDSINVTPINLDVSIGIEDFTAVNTISNKLRTWLTTGVSVSALIGALDDLDDSFFTLSNRNIIETINNQYTDFYD